MQAATAARGNRNFTMPGKTAGIEAYDETVAPPFGAP
jgi:hypothetical protein